MWANSSVGRAPPWHGGGQEFESPQVHRCDCIKKRLIRANNKCFLVSDIASIAQWIEQIRPKDGI